MNINLKKVISSVAALAMSLSCFTAFAADFSDVEATASYKNAIDELVALEVVNGYEDGTFKPEAEITRAEVTKMVVAAMGPSYTAAAESSKGGSGFSDVDAVNHWASGYISVGVAQSVINGMGDGTFAPDANVTYAQIVKMLVAALGYTPSAEINGGYPNGYIQTANQIGVTEGVSGVSADTNVTRAQVAQLISNALDIPLVLVTNWTTNILTGEPVAETKVMDGEEGRAYKTLLTEFHDTYKVKGRVTATQATSASVKIGKVNFRVEQADNFDGKAYDAYWGVDGSGNTVLYSSTTVADAAVGDTDAADQIFTYAEALIKLDADDEATILTILPYGKNEIVELDPENYVDPTSTYFTASSVDFTVSASSSRTKTYPLDANATLYVNGVRIAGAIVGGAEQSAITWTNFDSYITNNEIGKVTLINTPETGTTSRDNDYDYIMIDMPLWAIVDSTLVQGDLQKIYLDAFDAAVGTPINLDTSDEDRIYSFYKNGEEITFDEIKADDVLLVTFDPTKAVARDSRFIKIDVCDTVVEGQVTGVKTDAGKTIYTVNGAEYELVSGSLNAGDSYRLYLDATGRVVKSEIMDTSVNFAVVDRVYQDNNTQEYKIRLIKADGTREAYTAKDAAIKTAAANIAYGSDTLDGSLVALAGRAVTYKTNSNGEINSISSLAMTPDSDEFIESSTKVGAARMDESTQILDLTKLYLADEDDAATYTASDIKAGSLASFIDGETYGVLYGYRPSGYNTYKFVIITAGNYTITPSTGFAVIDGVGTSYNEDGTTVYTLDVYTSENKGEIVTYYCDEDIDLSLSGFVRGDVVILGFDGEGKVVKFGNTKTVTPLGGSPVSGVPAALFSASSFVPATMFNTSSNPMATDPKTGSTSKSFILSNVELGATNAWDSTDAGDNNYARVGFGVVLNNSNGVVTMARQRTAVSADDAGTPSTGVAGVATGDLISRGTEIEELTLANDVNVYVYDLNGKNASLLSVGATGSIQKTHVTDTDVIRNGGEDVYNWTTIAAGSGVSYTYAFYKVLNGDIQDIIVIIPRV